MSIFFITGQTAQRPNIEIKRSLVSLLTTKKLFGMSATWNYFEAGHGKGPCDGVGGTSKRMADQATKHNIRIQSTGDFYAWASSMESLVEYKFVGKEYCEKIADELNSRH